MEDLIEVKRVIEEADSIVFLGGAGVSTQSGIPDFRGSGGLYTTSHESDDAPEGMLTKGCLYQTPEKFYQFYRNCMVYPDAKPNDAHFALAKLEDQGRLLAVITQNIDGLHQAAGCENVLELHGSVRKNYCTKCGKFHSLAYLLCSEGVPTCIACGGMVRPDVVLYGEALDLDALMRAEDAVHNADVMIVGGTSLTVNPAASLVNRYRGEHLIIINQMPTPYDCYAEYVIREPIADVLRYLVG